MTSSARSVSAPGIEVGETLRGRLVGGYDGDSDSTGSGGIGYWTSGCLCESKAGQDDFSSIYEADTDARLYHSSSCRNLQAVSLSECI